MRPESRPDPNSTLNQAEWRTWKSTVWAGSSTSVEIGGKEITFGRANSPSRRRRSRRFARRHNGSGAGGGVRGARGSGLRRSRRTRRARVRRGKTAAFQAGRPRPQRATMPSMIDARSALWPKASHEAGDLHRAAATSSRRRHPLHQRRSAALMLSPLRYSARGARCCRRIDERVRLQPDARGDFEESRST